MRRRPNSHSPISLFPFLDTLVCTMGSLILMLLAIMPKLRERAEARQLERQAAAVAVVSQEPVGDEGLGAPAAAALNPQPQPAATGPDPDELERKRALRQSRRDAWQKMLDDGRNSLAGKAAELQKLRTRLKDARAWIRGIDEQSQKAREKGELAGQANLSLSQAEAKLRKQEELIAQKVAETRKNIELANRKQATNSNEYALVPYDGASGTVRRPIYIECNAKGYRFLAENQTLSLHELEGFTNTFNPLLTGTQALLLFWAQKHRQSRDEPEPYVLLLVRPGGIKAYYDARSRLAALGANFGYEIVDEDLKISIPESDPLARNILQEVIEKTLDEKDNLQRALARQSKRDDDWRNDTGFDEGDDIVFGGRGKGGGQGAGGPGGGGGRKGKSRIPSIQLGPATRPYRDSRQFAQNELDNAGSSTGRAASSQPRQATNSSLPKPTAVQSIPGGESDDSGTGSGSNTGRGTGAGTGKGSASARAAGISGRPGAGGDGFGGPGDGSLAREPLLGGSGAPGGSGTTRSSSGPGSGPDSGSPAGGDDDPLGLGTSRKGIDGRARGRGGAGIGGSRPATLGGSGFGAGAGDDGRDDAMPPLMLPDDALDQLPGIQGPGAKGPAGGSGGRGTALKMIPVPEGDSGPEGLNLPGVSDLDSGPGGSGAGPGGAGGGAARGSTRRGSSSSRTAARSSTGNTSSQAESSSDAGASDSDTAESGPGGPLSPGGPAGAGSPSAGGQPMPVQLGAPGMNFKLGSAGQRRQSKDEDDNGPRVPEEGANSGRGHGRSRGPRLWGQANRKATIGFERKIEIRILADRILVGSKDAVVHVGNGETVQEMVNHVVMRIEARAQQWGEAPQGYYWSPRAKFVVYPGGNQYYEVLQRELETEWGIPSTVDYVLAKSGKKAGTSKSGGPGK